MAGQLFILPPARALGIVGSVSSQEGSASLSSMGLPSSNWMVWPTEHHGRDMVLFLNLRIHAEGIEKNGSVVKSTCGFCKEMGLVPSTYLVSYSHL